MQAIDKFKLCYVRYQALLAQLHAEAGVSPLAAAAALPGGGANGHTRGTLLQHLLAAYASEGSGEGEGESCLLYSGGFEGSLFREVQRLRLFIQSSLEQLWLALLDACARLRAHGEELLQAGAAAACAGAPKQRMDARLANLTAEFDSLAAELVLVERFVRQNVGACAQLAQMYDQQAAASAGQLGSPAGQHSGGGGGAMSNGSTDSADGNMCGSRGSGELALEQVEGRYLAALQAALLGELRVEPLVVGLSDAYELCRQAAACCLRLRSLWVVEGSAHAGLGLGASECLRMPAPPQPAP
jgi:hypothetical protein